jgi:hypothetical protein
LSKASSVNDSAELQNMIECTLKQHIIDGHTQIYGPNGFSSMMQSIEPYFADVVLVENDGVYIIEEGFENEGAVFQYEHIKKHIFETLPGKNNTKRYLLGPLSSTKVDFLDINGYRFILHLSKTNIAQNKEQLILDVVDNLPIIYDSSYNHFDDSTRLKKYESIA